MDYLERLQQLLDKAYKEGYEKGLGEAASSSTTATDTTKTKTGSRIRKAKR